MRLSLLSISRDEGIFTGTSTRANGVCALRLAAAL
jgi:hypothetical protein